MLLRKQNSKIELAASVLSVRIFQVIWFVGVRRGIQLLVVFSSYLLSSSEENEGDKPQITNFWPKFPRDFFLMII